MFEPGDQQVFSCTYCGEYRSMTYKMTTVPVEGTPIVIINLLAAFCDECKNMVKVPVQSAVALQKVLDKLKG